MSGLHMEEDWLPPAPWLHLLSPMWRAWREKQFLKGRDPDAYIEEQLHKDGLWPPKESGDA
jgi:hypothetical protein